MARPRSCIFIKSWLNDLDWLYYCIKSILKYYTLEHMVIILDEDCRGTPGHLRITNLFYRYIQGQIEFKFIPTILPPTGYLTQQLEKLKAFEHTDAEHILFTDSDIVFTKKTTIDAFLLKGNPVIYSAFYGPRVGGANCWQEPTQQITGVSPIKSEYMRCFPIVYRRDTVQKAYEKYLPRIQEYISHDWKFSEFNLLGVYASQYEPDRYQFINYHEEHDLPIYTACRHYQHAKQYWSWGGLTDDIRVELEQITAEDSPSSNKDDAL